MNELKQALKNGANFVTIKWIKVNDLSDGQYSIYMNIRFKTLMLRSEFYDYSDVYIFVEGRKTIEGRDIKKQAKRKKIFKNNALFRSLISKMNNNFIYEATVKIVTPMYNLIEYSDSYSITWRRL